MSIAAPAKTTMPIAAVVCRIRSLEIDLPADFEHARRHHLRRPPEVRTEGVAVGDDPGGVRQVVEFRVDRQPRALTETEPLGQAQVDLIEAIAELRLRLNQVDRLRRGAITRR